MSGEIFLAYDVRGVYNVNLSEDVAERLGVSLGALLGEGGRVVVGYDTRYSSPKLCRFLVKGVLKAGCDVVSIGLVPAPVAYFYAFKEDVDACVYVTASHNPPIYNGFKFLKKGGVFFGDRVDELKEIYFSKAWPQAGRLGSYDEDLGAFDRYEDYLMKHVDIDGFMSIVTDSFFGASSKISGRIFRDFGLRVKALRDEPKGDFGGLRPEPTEENLQALAEEVLREEADFGVAFDGDGDRSVFIDDKGRPLIGGSMGSIFAEYILSRGKGKVVATVDCAYELKHVVESLGGTLIWSRVGSRFIQEAVVREEALFGCEQSSHFYFNQLYPFSDGMLATLLLAKILTQAGVKLSELADRRRIHPVRKVYIDCGTHDLKLRVMERVKETALRMPNPKDFLDGVKVYLNKFEWVLIRPSNTEPALTLVIEAEDEKRLRELLEIYRGRIEAVKASLTA